MNKRKEPPEGGTGAMGGAGAGAEAGASIGAAADFASGPLGPAGGAAGQNAALGSTIGVGIKQSPTEIGKPLSADAIKSGFKAGIAFLDAGIQYYQQQQAIEFSKEAFRFGKDAARTALVSDYAGAYKRMQEEAMQAEQQVRLVAGESRAAAGIALTSAAGAGLAGQSVRDVFDQIGRSALIQEGAQRSNLVLLQRQLWSDMVAARDRAKARFVDAAGAPVARGEWLGSAIQGGAQAASFILSL